MKLSEEQYELIEAYLTNELSANDRTSLESDMQSDLELQAEVDRQRDLRLGLRALGIQAAIGKARLQYQTTFVSSDDQTDAVPLVGTRSTVVRSLSGWRYWAAAASIVTVLGISYYAYQQMTGQRSDLAYTDNFVPDRADELTKDFPAGTLPTAVRNQLLDALVGYKAGQYDRVIARLNTLPADRQTIHYKNYFLGLSHLANKQPTVAIPLLRQALAAPSLNIRQKAEWFLALAYVKNNQNEKALPLLKRISTDKANPFQTLAQQVLQKIN